MNKPVVITSGEPAGIGPDLAVMLAAHLDEALSHSNVQILGDPEVLAARAKALNMPFGSTRRRLIPVAAPMPVTPGKLDPANSRYVLAMLDRAVDGCRNGEFAAMLTAPLHKGIINNAGIPFTGHTEYLAARTGGHPVMMLVADNLRVALATTHLPIARVAESINRQDLEAVIRGLIDGLRTHFAIPDPKVLVAGLNPHAGEGGHLGREEVEIITPLLHTLRREGMRLEGPLPADTLFTPHHLDGADAVLAMFHDQGLPVLKYVGFGKAVNVTLGLPIIRTSVDHGTALDKAGKGGVDAGSLQAALALTLRMVAKRKSRL